MCAQAADVWTIGCANKPGKEEAMRDAGADAVLGSMAEPARAAQQAPVETAKT